MMCFQKHLVKVIVRLSLLLLVAVFSLRVINTPAGTSEDSTDQDNHLKIDVSATQYEVRDQFKIGNRALKVGSNGMKVDQFDPDDEFFCGTICLRISDSDCLPLQTVGSHFVCPLTIEHATSLDSTDDDHGWRHIVVLTATTAVDPISYIKVEDEENKYLSGQIIFGDLDDHRPIGRLIAMDGKQALKHAFENEAALSPSTPSPSRSKMREEGKVISFDMKLEIKPLKNGNNRLADVKVTVTRHNQLWKITEVRAVIPRSSWEYWKEYQVRALCGRQFIHRFCKAVAKKKVRELASEDKDGSSSSDDSGVVVKKKN